jgi:uncharacterized protein (TIGR03435 family)
VLLLVAAAVVASPVRAQVPPASAFDAASVKAVPESVGYPPRAGYWVEPHVVNPQRFRALVQAGRLVEWAYGIRHFQLLGGPPWMKDPRARFAVEATTAEPATADEMKRMAQNLLTDRFHFNFHRETRMIPVFVLLVGRNGPKLKEAADSTINHGNGNFDIGQGQFRGRGATMAPFVDILTENLDRPVIDRTNLTGHYDFTLHFDPASLTDWRLGPILPSLVQDIGLRLERQTESIEMIVVDSIERVTEN